MDRRAFVGSLIAAIAAFFAPLREMFARFLPDRRTDIERLIDDLTVKPVAVYDSRHGVTYSGGSVASWQDARGTGYGPTLEASPPASFIGSPMNVDEIGMVMVFPKAELPRRDRALLERFVRQWPTSPPA